MPLPRIYALLCRWALVLTAAAFFPAIDALSASAADLYQGKYTQGTGDAAALQRIDQSFQFFHANPDVPNLTMLYKPGWDTFVEGAGWNAWWIQNSYGFSYAATPFLQPFYRTTLQKSLDMFWNNQGDGARKGLWGSSDSLLYNLVAPDGALGDCVTPNSIVYKQGDGNVAIHDWMHEATAAGVVMQSEMLLTSRDRTAIAKYLPKMERACDSIETTRDPGNHLFLVGPAANLLAPSYGGVQQSYGAFAKGYLTGLSITYLAAVDRMVELYKMTGDTVKQAEFAHRAEITRASLSQLTATGAQGDYFVKSVEKTSTGDLGTRHGVVGQTQFGYLEGVANVDAIALRVADAATAQSIYNTIAANPAIRPNDFLLTNSTPLDDTYWNYGGTEVGEGFEKFGQWVNGGAWGTVEGRAILAYSQLGKFDDITLSADRAMQWAKDFRMDAPFSQSGANTSNPWSDTGSNQIGGTSVMIDNFAIPAATIRGLFDYEYRSDRLVLRPRLPGEISEYVQNEPVYFGDKKIYLTCQNGGPNIVSVTVNGTTIDVSSAAEVDLLYASLPADAHVAIVTNGGWAASTLSPGTAATFTTAAPAPLAASLRTPYGAMKTMSRLLEHQANADYERSFVGETIGAIEAWQVSRSTDRGPGIDREMTPEKIAAIDQLYLTSAQNMYSGLAGQMAESALNSLWNTVLARTGTSEMRVLDPTSNPLSMTVDGSDLANQGQGSLLSVVSTASGDSGKLNDGQMNDSGADLGSTLNAYMPAEGEQLIFVFDTSTHPQGYDISQILSYAASDVDRITQNYDIDVMQVGATEWGALFSGYDMGRDAQAIFDADSLGREMKVTVQDRTGALLATNVWKLRFTFHDTNGFGLGGGAETVYREFDILGTASVPEPASLTLATVGVMFAGALWFVSPLGGQSR